MIWCKDQLWQINKNWGQVNREVLYLHPKDRYMDGGRWVKDDAKTYTLLIYSLLFWTPDFPLKSSIYQIFCLVLSPNIFTLATKIVPRLVSNCETSSSRFLISISHYEDALTSYRISRLTYIYTYSSSRASLRRWLHSKLDALCVSFFK